MHPSRRCGGFARPVFSRSDASRSGVRSDPSSKRILSTGYNGFPSGIDDSIESRYERPAKYDYTAHAEANAIYTAARQVRVVSD